MNLEELKDKLKRIENADNSGRDKKGVMSKVDGSKG